MNDASLLCRNLAIAGFLQAHVCGQSLGSILKLSGGYSLPCRQTPLDPETWNQSSSQLCTLKELLNGMHSHKASCSFLVALFAHISTFCLHRPAQAMNYGNVYPSIPRTRANRDRMPSGPQTISRALDASVPRVGDLGSWQIPESAPLGQARAGKCSHLLTSSAIC